MDHYGKYKKYKAKYLRLKTEGMVPNLSLRRDHGTDGAFSAWRRGLNVDTVAFCLKFEKDNHILYYIGAQHTTDPTSDTFGYIETVVRKLCPETDIVLLEGIPRKMGISPPLSHFHGEGKFASDLARQRGIPYSGIEADEDDLLRSLAETYDPDDICGFLYLRMHKYFYRTLRKTRAEFVKDFAEYEAPTLARTLGASCDPTEWFRRTFGKEFRYGRYLEYASPSRDSKIITQRISFDYGELRDGQNLKTLYYFLSHYRTVLYIMGMNHVYADLPVLVDTFGGYRVVASDGSSRDAELTM